MADKSGMEKRAGPRFPSDQSVSVTVLDDGRGPVRARIENVSGSGMRLALERSVHPGALLKIEWDDTLLLGEVCYCEPVGKGYAAGLELQHALLHTRELARLSRRLLCEEEQRVSPAPEHSH